MTASPIVGKGITWKDSPSNNYVAFASMSFVVNLVSSRAFELLDFKSAVSYHLLSSNLVFLLFFLKCHYHFVVVLIFSFVRLVFSTKTFSSFKPCSRKSDVLNMCLHNISWSP